MNLNEWYTRGMTPDNYMDTLDKLKEHFLHIYNTYNIPVDEKFSQAVKESKLRVIILTEVWCGHCMLNIPILLRLAEKVGMPVRLLARDKNLEIMNQYLTNGNRTIPIFIFIDENGNEVTKWGPMANTTKQFVDTFRVNLPSKDAVNYQEEYTKMIILLTKSFRDTPKLWDGVYDSLKQKLID